MIIFNIFALGLALFLGFSGYKTLATFVIVFLVWIPCLFVGVKKTIDLIRNIDNI